MPNQCIHCSEIYPDGAREIIEGCSKCRSRFFFYLSEEKLQKIRENKEGNVVQELTSEEKKNIEQDVREITGITEIDAPVILDLETVKVTSPGKYLLDIPNLFSKERPLVYKLEDGKYVIDLSSTIKKK
ncbi:MAG: Zn-ribbon containing protein [Nanoarchaeota archaeon]